MNTNKTSNRADKPADSVALTQHRRGEVVILQRLLATINALPELHERAGLKEADWCREGVSGARRNIDLAIKALEANASVKGMEYALDQVDAMSALIMPYAQAFPEEEERMRLLFARIQSLHDNRRKLASNPKLGDAAIRIVGDYTADKVEGIVIL
jgi:hypothetical protein